MMKVINVLCFVLVCYSLNAQTNLPDDGVPVDGGISALMAAGIGYGIKKIKDSKNKLK